MNTHFSNQARKRIQKLLLVAFALAFVSTATAQTSVSGIEAGNVGTRQFDVLWKVSDTASTPGVHIFADSAATNEITDTLQVQWYPVQTGDPTLPDSGSLNAREAAQDAILQQGLAWVRISGVSPDTTYYVEPDSLNAEGASNLSGTPPQITVTTAARAGFVSDFKQVLSEFSSLPSAQYDGAIARLSADGSPYPLFSAAGDGTADDAAFFNLGNLLDSAGETNRDPSTALQLTLSLLGDSAPGGNQGLSISFDGTYAVAAAEMVAFNPSVGSIAGFRFDPIGEQRERVPFTVSITAVDSGGAVVSSFEDRVEVTSSANLEQGGGETATFSDGVLSGHTVELTGTGSQTLTATLPGGSVPGTSDPFNVLPGETYDSWKQDEFGSEASDPTVSGLLRDPDEDGRSNLMEFAAGLDPMDEDLGMRRSGREEDGDNEQVVFSYYRLKDRVTLSYTVQQATSPVGPWSPVSPAPEDETVSDVDSQTEKVEVAVDAPDGDDQLYLRLKVSTQ